MKINLNKVAAMLAVIIGGMSVVAGGLVLLGADPGYNVINWLALYNYTVGILTVIITAVLIYTNHRLALPAAIDVGSQCSCPAHSANCFSRNGCARQHPGNDFSIGRVGHHPGVAAFPGKKERGTA